MRLLLLVVMVVVMVVVVLSPKRVRFLELKNVRT